MYDFLVIFDDFFIADLATWVIEYSSFPHLANFVYFVGEVGIVVLTLCFAFAVVLLPFFVVKWFMSARWF